MFFAKSKSDIRLTRGVRALAVGIIIASVLLGFLLNLPATLARGPIATIIVAVEMVAALRSLLPLLRTSGDGPDGA